MADYRSTLTGVQMDSALIDMAEHNSEAWAVGERVGIPVASDDVTYHNNAKYYASQAQSIAPASVTEAVRWDIAQTALTDAQRLQARDNIYATSHNPNLLDNGFFTVNSRGQSSYTASALMRVVDRWFITAGGSFAINSGYITATGQAGGVLGQYLNSLSIGTTYTASVKKSDGTISSITFSPVANTENIYSVAGMKLEVDTRTAYAAHPRFMLYDNAAWSANISAVKLELGSFSTLAYDTPPDYGEELTRCIYSTADPSDTYANNGFGRTNPNLFDNPFFQVNQRGITTQDAGSATLYCLDRWRNARSVITVNSDGSITLNANTALYGILQIIEKTRLNVDDTYTLSVLLTNGTILSGSFVYTTSAGYFNLGDGASLRGYKSTDGQKVNVWVVPVSAGVNFTIRAIKLELGTVSTLANDVPPDYGTELAKCMRYFRRFAPQQSGMVLIGRANSTTLANFLVGTEPMAKITGITATITGECYVRAGDNTNHAITAVNAQSTVGSGVMLECTTSGITAYAPAAVVLAAGAHIDICADL